MPAYNEGENIERAIAELYEHAPFAKRVLVVYDFDEDTTVPVVRRLMPEYAGLELVKNDLGKGVLCAIKAGIAAARADVVIVTMADLSDDLRVVPRMVQLIRDDGYDVVAASRYMKGGAQIGGPALKGMLSRAAGVSLHALAGLPTHDATNSFRAFRKSFLDATPIESTHGFTFAIELTVKAYAQGKKIAEVPATWRDRTAGESRFELRKWLPHYVKWWAYAFTHRPR
jgi:glycosyltransferase involved in cell wall biosynthesis